MSKRFAIWIHRDYALICDRDAPPEHGCRVVWNENNTGRDVGTLLTKNPAKSKQAKRCKECGQIPDAGGFEHDKSLLRADIYLSMGKV